MNKHLIIGLSFLVAVVSASYILGNAYKYKFKSGQTIDVTGNAEKNFESDIITWSATFSKNNFDLKAASEELKKDKEIIKNYLLNQGVPQKEFSFGSIDIQKDYINSYDQNTGRSYSRFNGYNLSQTVGIASNNLDKVDEISREISDLISQGIELSSQPANYYYSKLEDLKLELISKASNNAKLRAQNIAKEADAQLGNLQKADLGIFQITGQNENESYSYGGAFNTSSRYKTANITVRASYTIK